MSIQHNPMVMSDTVEPLTDLPTRYEDALLELEQIIHAMEDGQLSLEESVNAYQKGSFLIQHCQQLLENAEQSVQMLNDQQRLEPFNPDA